MSALGQGSEIRGRLAGGGTDEHSIELAAGTFMKIETEQLRLDVAVELVDPGGTSLIWVDSPIGRLGKENLVAVAQTAGTYKIRILATEADAPPGEYLLRVIALRLAGMEDRQRALAAQAIAEGDRLRRGGTGEGLAQACERYESALASCLRLEDAEGEPEALFRLGLANALRGNRAVAASFLEDALARYRHLAGREREAGFVLNNLGALYRDLGRLEEARQSFEENVSPWVMPDVRSAALGNLGLMRREAGEPEKALEAYFGALELLSQDGEPRQEVAFLNNIGQLLIAQGKPREARDYLDRAVAILLLHTDAPRESQILANRAEAYKREGDLEAAAADLERALMLAEKLADPIRIAGRLNNLGTVKLLAGRAAEAKSDFEKALQLYRVQGEQRRGEGLALHNLGRVELPDPVHGSKGNPARAKEMFQTAAIFLEGSGDPLAEVSNNYGLALALTELGDLEGAREALAKSLAKVEKLRSNSGGENLRIAFFASKQHYSELEIELLMRLDQKHPRVGYSAAAFVAAERRRSRALLDLLGDSAKALRQGVRPELLEKEEQAQAALNQLEFERSRRSRNSTLTQTLPEQMRAAQLELDRIRQQLRLEGRRIEQISSEPRSLVEVQEGLLQDGSLLLAYSLGDRRSFLWLVSRSEVETFELPGRQAIEALAGRVYRAVSTRRSPPMASERQKLLEDLGGVLLKPLQGKLGWRRLLIVADGDLAFVPFAALIEPGVQEPLVARHEIAYLPSASVILSLRELLTEREVAPLPIAIFADPAISAPGPGEPVYVPLPQTRIEAEEINNIFGGEARLYLGRAATKKNVSSADLARYQILHFATHGEINNLAPELSGLVLASEEDVLPADGFLRLHELYKLDLKAELVVLSACRTGLGPKAKGEGLIGMTRGFMHAGVPRLLASLWNISDGGTAELMKRFYWALVEGRAAPAKALQVAQLALIEEDPDGKTFGDPFVWAAFVLQGDWRPAGKADGGIEAAATGAILGDQESIDLPGPVGCAGSGEGWKQIICRLLNPLTFPESTEPSVASRRP